MVECIKIGLTSESDSLAVVFERGELSYMRSSKWITCVWLSKGKDISHIWDQGVGPKNPDNGGSINLQKKVKAHQIWKLTSHLFCLKWPGVASHWEDFFLMRIIFLKLCPGNCHAGSNFPRLCPFDRKSTLNMKISTENSCWKFHQQ